MRILLTGGGGFIGSHLTAALEGHEIASPHEHQMDLRDTDSIKDWVTATVPDIVIHLAAKTEVAHSFDDYEDFGNVNYLGTVRLAEANRLYNPNLKQFIFASTMETYGHHVDTEVPFTEHTSQYPMAPYAVAKLAAERYLAYLKYAYKFPFTIFRQTNAYGRTNTTFFVMERIISQMLAGDVVNLGARSPVRNFLFIDDLITLYLAALNNPNAIGEIFVTGPDNGISIEELVAKCADLLEWKGVVNWNTIPTRPGEIYYLDSAPYKAKRLLGWEPRVDLNEGILRTAQRIEDSTSIKARAAA